MSIRVVIHFEHKIKDVIGKQSLQHVSVKNKILTKESRE